LFFHINQSAVSTNRDYNKTRHLYGYTLQNGQQGISGLKRRNVTKRTNEMDALYTNDVSDCEKAVKIRK
jgi:hypothetical protein